jgi:hypothetical protein
MKELLIIPGIALLMLGFVVQLEGIAKQSSEKAIKFSQDMNNAMDCAFLGKPIRECSPNLMNRNFNKEVNQTQNILLNITSTLKSSS